MSVYRHVCYILLDEHDLRDNTLNPLAKMRQRRTPWARRVLGVFVVVWLNMALQPCAMAFGGPGEHDCLHCPPAHAEEGSAHSQHHSDDSDSVSSPCEMGASQCTFGDDFNYDGRILKVKVKDVPVDVPLAIAPGIAEVSLAAISPAVPCNSIRSYIPGDPPPLNVLYCVYLD